MGYTAKLPQWARALSAYEAQGDEDMAYLRGGDPAVTPEEAYGFERSSGGVPGRIHGTTRQMDMTSLRAFRNRTSPGMLTPGDINARVNANAMAQRAQRMGMWENYLRQSMGQPRPAPTHGEQRTDAGGNLWQYDATQGKGVQVPKGQAALPIPGAGVSGVGVGAGGMIDPATAAAAATAASGGPNQPVWTPEASAALTAALSGDGPKMPNTIAGQPQPEEPKSNATFFEPDKRGGTKALTFNDWKKAHTKAPLDADKIDYPAKHQPKPTAAANPVNFKALAEASKLANKPGVPTITPKPVPAGMLTQKTAPTAPTAPTPPIDFDAITAKGNAIASESAADAADMAQHPPKPVMSAGYLGNTWTTNAPNAKSGWEGFNWQNAQSAQTTGAPSTTVAAVPPPTSKK